MGPLEEQSRILRILRNQDYLVVTLHVRVFCLHVCTCTTYLHGGQKKALGPLGLELQVIVGHHVGAGKQTQVLSKSSKSS